MTTSVLPGFQTSPHSSILALARQSSLAGRCQQSLQYGIRTYVDEMDDAVNKAYAAWPTRLHLLGQDGRVVYRGAPGPFGFKPAALREAIATYLARPEAVVG